MEIIDGKDLINMKFIKTEDGLLKEYKPQGRFIPKKDETYCSIEINGNIGFYKNYNDTIDNYVIAHNLVFRTEEEAGDYKWFLEQLYEYETDFSKEERKNENIRKWYLYYSYCSNGIETDYSSVYQLSNYYFTKENVEKFIEIVGEDRIKRYMFDIWE